MKGVQVVVDQVAGAHVVVDGPSERRSGSGRSSGRSQSSGGWTK